MSAVMEQEPEAAGVMLYAPEGYLIELLDTEGAVEEEQKEALQVELAHALRATARTERVGQTILRLEAEAEFCKSEAKRIRAYGQRLEDWAERIREGVLAYIMGRGFDPKGKLTRLNGKTVTMSARSNPASVDVIDADSIPPKYKVALPEIPMDLWYKIVDAFPNETAGLLKEVKVDKASIKEAIKRGEDVRGADLNIGTYSLQVR